MAQARKAWFAYYARFHPEWEVWGLYKLWRKDEHCKNIYLALTNAVCNKRGGKGFLGHTNVESAGYTSRISLKAQVCRHGNPAKCQGKLVLTLQVLLCVLSPTVMRLALPQPPASQPKKAFRLLIPARAGKITAGPKPRRQSWRMLSISK
eukprot:g80378.t1